MTLTPDHQTATPAEEAMATYVAKAWYSLNEEDQAALTAHLLRVREDRINAELPPGVTYDGHAFHAAFPDLFDEPTFLAAFDKRHWQGLYHLPAELHWVAANTKSHQMRGATK